MRPEVRRRSSSAALPAHLVDHQRRLADLGRDADGADGTAVVEFAFSLLTPFYFLKGGLARLDTGDRRRRWLDAFRIPT
jgi:hypothetical protein